METNTFKQVGDNCYLALGDALKNISNLPDDSVDLIVTDPPYNLGLFMKKRGTNMNKLRNGHFAAAGWDDLDFEDWLAQIDTLFSECSRLLKKRGSMIMFMSIIKVESVIQIAQKYGFYYKTVGVWHKTNPLPRNMNLQFINSTETWIYLVNKATTGTFNNEGKALHDFVETSTINNGERKLGKHPTQKPVELMKFFIKTLSNENDVVLDPFMGSGTSGVACRQLGRAFYGVEICEDYYKISEQRILEIR